MTDAERTQFIARTPAPPVALRRPDYAEPDDEDNRRTGLIWAAIVAALLLVIGAAAYAIVFLGKDNGPTKVAVPSTLIGKTEDAAIAAIRQANLVPNKGDPVTSDCDNGQPPQKDRVCQVRPQGGEQVAKGTTVTYHLYTPALVNVPPLEGHTLADAEAQLNQLKLKWTIKYVRSTEAKNTVIAQDPGDYKPVQPGSSVQLSVSTGKVKLPDVRNLTFDAAQAKLNQAGFLHVTQASSTVTTTDQSKDGLVVQESPTAGFAYPPDTQITLTLYHFQAPSTTPTSPTGSGSSGPSGLPTPTP